MDSFHVYFEERETPEETSESEKKAKEPEFI
jgi:hypothetical protein